MKRLKLKGIGNESNRIFFVFEKDDKFFTNISFFLANLSLDKTGIMYGHDEKKKDIKNTFDVLENTKNKDYDLDIFYGKSRIIVVIRTDEKNRDIIIKNLKKIADYKGFN